MSTAKSDFPRQVSSIAKRCPATNSAGLPCPSACACRNASPRQIVAICEEIDRLESDADHVMRAAMSKLFRDEPDVRNLIKMKAIYEILETVTDRCEDVANIIEGIIVENA